MTNYHYWQYFLTLETDLITTSRYIEFSGVNDNTVKNNDKTFSTELLRIFLTACAECENILKILLAKENVSENIIKSADILKIRDIMMSISTYHKLPNRIITCEAYNLNFTPWAKWNNSRSSPQWWKDHNSVKHGRANGTNSNYHLANVFNTLNSVAALMCLLFEYYKESFGANEGRVIKDRVSLPPALAPKLFTPKESGLGFGGIYWIWQPEGFSNT